MNRILALMSLFAGLAALVRCTLERRGPGRLPIAVLIRDRFAGTTTAAVVAGFACGTAVILGPLGIELALGWASLETAGPAVEADLILVLATVVVKAVWAAAEELIFRGAILPQVARHAGGAGGLFASALLFGWGHLERSGARAPGLASMLLFAIDGLGFGVAYLTTRNLWMPTTWHAAKNLWIWLLYSESTVQFAPGLFRGHVDGPALWVGAGHEAGLLDLVISAAVVVLVALMGRQRLAEGLAWVRGQ